MGGHRFPSLSASSTHKIPDEPRDRGERAFLWEKGGERGPGVFVGENFFLSGASS